MNIFLHSFGDEAKGDLYPEGEGARRTDWIKYSAVIMAGLGFLAGIAVIGIKKPGFWEASMTTEEYYRYASVVPPPQQEIGIFDDILEREYFSPSLVKKAFAGDVQAQYHLAWCYDTKNATPVQQAEAAYWYLQSARKGHYQSTCTIGEFYLQGIAVPQSDQEAVYWLKKSALKGNSRAAYLLGECYLAGRGVKKDMQEAIHWLKQGSDIYRGGKTTAKTNGGQASAIQRISRGDRKVTLKTFMRGYQVFTDWVVPPLILLLCLGAFLTIMKK